VWVPDQAIRINLAAAGDNVGPIALVFVGGAVGAGMRYLVGNWAGSRWSGTLPYGTLVINLGGSFLLGVLTGVGHHLGRPWGLLAGVGFIGAFTTFSTLSYETLRLLEQGALVEGLLNPVLSLVLGLMFAMLGVVLGQAIA
jgi:CrcB protein